MEYTNHNINNNLKNANYKKCKAKSNFSACLPSCLLSEWVKENKTSSLETPSTDESHEM